MSRAAPSLPLHGDEPALHHYEQPLTERMRTFLRLEFLYQQLLYNASQDADWATRAATSSLLDTVAILSRGDVRSDVLKELDQRIEGLQRFRARADVDTATLQSLVTNLEESRRNLQTIGAHYLQPLRDSEFLNAIKYRSGVPGGTCEFDLPEYSHWLRQPHQERYRDFSAWLQCVEPICDAVGELLWLIREISSPADRRAVNGMYQHNVPRETPCQLLRVSLPGGSPLFPNISGSHRRFTIRFLEWSTTEQRAVAVSDDVDFALCIC